MRFLRIVAWLLLTGALLGSITPGAVSAVTWSSTPTSVPAESCSTYSCFGPSAAQDSQGKIWLFWENFQRSDIYYKTYDPLAQTWSNDEQLSRDIHYDVEPTVTGLNNGSFMVFWSAKRTGSRHFDIYSAYTHGSLTSNLATVTITVTNTASGANAPYSTEMDAALTAPNAPVAVDDSYSTPKNTVLSVPPLGVLANDWDPEGDALSAALVDGPPSGTLLLGSDGGFAYVPASNFVGQVTFTYQASETITWSSESPVVSDTSGTVYIDRNPSALQTRSGDIWLVWNRNQTSTGNNCPCDLWYRVNNGVSWSPERKLTNSTGASTGDDKEAYLAQTKDGKIWVTWTARRNNIDEIHYLTFNGVTWSQEGCIVGTTTGCTVPGGPAGDLGPAIIQDRDGTIWTVFSRNIIVTKQGNEISVPDLYYVKSVDNGASWSPAAALTGTSGADEVYPSIYQFKSQGQRSLWVFYTESVCSGNSCTVELRYLTSSEIVAHDVRMDQLSADPVSLRSGETMTLRAWVTNLGDFAETVQLSVVDQYGNIIGTNSTPVPVGGSGQLLVLKWYTTSVAPGTYTLKGTLSVPGETLGNIVDNSVSVTVLIRPQGDINGDCAVNIDDLSRVGRAFGSVIGPPASPNWDPIADTNKDGVINIDDLAAVGHSFGQTC